MVVILLPKIYNRFAYFTLQVGMRIDFLLGSADLAGRVAAASIDREERKGKGASDHAPVIVDLFTPAPGQDLPL